MRISQNENAVPERVSNAASGDTNMLERYSRIALGIIVCYGTLIRVIDLRTVGPYFADEVFSAVTAHDIIRHGTQFNGEIAGVFDRIQFFLSGAEFAVWFGNGSIPTLRLVSVVFGLASIIGVYLLGSEIMNRTFGILSAAIFAAMPWSIYYSRIDFSTGEVLCLEIFAAFLGISGLRLAESWRVCLSIGLTAACIYLYTAALVSAPISLIVAIMCLRW